VADIFLSAVARNIAKFFPKGPENDENYCRIVSKSHTDRLKKIISVDKPHVVFGGEYDVNAKYISPTLIDFKNDWEEFKTSCSMESEIFGPILPLVRYKDTHEVESFLRARMRSQPPLAFYIFTSESRRAIRNRWVSADYPAGALVINDCGMHVVEDCLPFGGVGASGIGNYHGRKSFETFTHYKPVLFKTGWLDIPMRYPPMSQFNRTVVRLLLWLGRRNVTPLNMGKFVLVVALLWRIMKK
jgi:aldehyde dehydrogenase (NAD+)